MAYSDANKKKIVRHSMNIEKVVMRFTYLKLSVTVSFHIHHFLWAGYVREL